MREYTVIAEMVDATSGDRFYPGQAFTPADDVQLARLIAAGVLDADPSEVVPLGITPGRDDLGLLDLKKASKAQLLVIAVYEQADVPKGDAATLPELRAAINDARQPGYDRDTLGVLPLQDRSEDQLRTIAAYEKVDVADDATTEDLVKAIEAKRNGAA